MTGQVLHTEGNQMSVTATHDPRAMIPVANRVRTTRAGFRRTVREMGVGGGEALAAALIADAPWLASMYVWQVVRYVPKVGDAKAGQMLKAAGIDPWRRVGRMTPRMRMALVEQLHRHAEGLPVSAPEPPVDPMVCRGCGERLRSRSASGCCGFCEAEAAGSVA